MIFGPK